MKNLLSLMEEFSILGMQPAPLEDENAMDFMPQGEVVPVDEYELDAEGNPLLDAQGNPIKKLNPMGVTPGADPAVCPCAHGATDPAAQPVPGAIVPQPEPGAMMPPAPPEDEFDFKI